MNSLINEWWKIWRQRARPTSLLGELERAAVASGPSLPSPPTSPVVFGMERRSAPESITPATAAVWLSLFLHQAKSSQAHKALPHQHLPTGRRKPIATEFATGLTLFHGAASSPGLRQPDGSLLTDPARAEEQLFQSRKEIWTNEPDEGPAAGPLLDHYFADPSRRAAFPLLPNPDASTIAAKFLACGGSAAGIDGRPYEVYHHGLAFTSFLLGQAFHATHAGDITCAAILGPHTDLGVWIPKKDGADTPAGQRPLQLPSTLRRTFGAVLMDIVGPIVEPRFSRHQAAVRGGSCGPNIILTFHHLASLHINPTPPRPALAYPSWPRR